MRLGMVGHAYYPHDVRVRRQCEALRCLSEQPFAQATAERNHPAYEPILRFREPTPTRGTGSSSARREIHDGPATTMRVTSENTCSINSCTRPHRHFGRGGVQVYTDTVPVNVTQSANMCVPHIGVSRWHAHVQRLNYNHQHAMGAPSMPCVLYRY